MTMIDVPCGQCAGKGWKNCPLCPGDGKARCLNKCDSGVLPCPAHCNEGYSRTDVCTYCSDGKPTCDACGKRGFIRCIKCNPWSHGMATFEYPGKIRCPAQCEAGYYPCPVCCTYKALFGEGKVGCEGCNATGVIAVYQPDPPDDPATA